MSRLKNLEDIHDIFSIFHDGSIEEYTGDMTFMKLTISCTYLAELINKDYNNFYVELENITRLEFKPWWNDLDRPEEVLMIPGEIFTGDKEITSADVTGDFVTVYIYEHDSDLPYSGGNLHLSCKSIRVYDEVGRQMTVDELSKVCRAYWDNFGRND